MRKYITLTYAEAETGELLLAEAPEYTYLHKGDLIRVDGYDGLCEVIESLYSIGIGSDAFEMIHATAGDIQGKILAKFKRDDIKWGDEDDNGDGEV